MMCIIGWILIAVTFIALAIYFVIDYGYYDEEEFNRHYDDDDYDYYDDDD